MNVYVASSWRNEFHPGAVRALRSAGHEVYDFRNPAFGCRGFHWSKIDPDWQQWNSKEFKRALGHSVARQGFDLDRQAMRQADACVLVMPCGRSAHLEAGWFVGQAKPLVILLADGEPELMYKLADKICVDLAEVLEYLKEKKCLK